MARVTKVVRQCAKAAEDMNLLKVLQSEIKYELSSNRFQNDKTGPLGDFVIDWDSPQSKDVVLRKKFDSGEELAVSALLDHQTYEVEKRFPMECLMKVCIKKPGLSSILQFDCGVSGKGEKGSEFAIQNAYYLPSSTSLGPSVYKGPLFSTLDPNLQDELKQYLVSRGIGESFTNFLLFHLHKKEQSQYMNWLQSLESVAGAQNDD